MFRYRLYTEDRNKPLLDELISAAFDSYTIRYAQGVWKNKLENSVVYEIITDELSALSQLQHIGRIIRKENTQEAVLVTREPVESFIF